MCIICAILSLTLPLSPTNLLSSQPFFILLSRCSPLPPMYNHILLFGIHTHCVKDLGDTSARSRGFQTPFFGSVEIQRAPAVNGIVPIPPHPTNVLGLEEIFAMAV